MPLLVAVGMTGQLGAASTAAEADGGSDFAASPKLTAAQIRDLAALRWPHSGELILLHGPVGVGKTHIAQALVPWPSAEAPRSASTRPAAPWPTSPAATPTAPGRAGSPNSSPRRAHLGQLRHARAHRPQADDLYELISERTHAGRSLITTSNRNPLDWYPLFPNPVVAESLLDRLLNNSPQVFMNGPSYRPQETAD
jgi:hypothetical protein